LGPGERQPRLRFLIESPFWGQVFSQQGSGFSSTHLFGARFSASKVQVSHRLTFLGPGFQSARFRFLIDSPFWGQVRSQQDSGFSSTHLFGARFSASKAQVFHRLTFLGPGFQSARLKFFIDSPFLGPGFQSARLRFLIDSPFWGQVFSQQGSGFSSTHLFGAR
jgi:hypothetical protein